MVDDFHLLCDAGELNVNSFNNCNGMRDWTLFYSATELATALVTVGALASVPRKGAALNNINRPIP